MNILLYILIALIAIGIIANIIYSMIAAKAPDVTIFERKKLINAPKEKIWNLVRTFEARKKWSPWFLREPNAETKIEGIDGEVGTEYSWVGKKLGQGSQKLLTTIPNEKFESKLIFTKPFESEADEYLLLDEKDGQTEVTWGLKAYNKTKKDKFFVGSGMFEKMMSKDYMAGLDQLKNLAES